MNSLTNGVQAAVERALQAAVERALEPVLRRLDAIEERFVKVEELLDDIARALQTRERVVQGWAAIGAEIGYSESHARKMGRRELYADPVPHHRRRGHVVALVSELRAWQARQSRSGSSVRRSPAEPQMIANDRSRRGPPCDPRVKKTQDDRT
jgi:hypothetical protein